jgi:hypothetical protein
MMSFVCITWQSRKLRRFHLSIYMAGMHRVSRCELSMKPFVQLAPSTGSVWLPGMCM